MTATASKGALRCFLRGASCRGVYGAVPPGALASHAVPVRGYSPSPPPQRNAWDPAQADYKYWNREESVHGEATFRLEVSPESTQREARILCLAANDDAANGPLTAPAGALPFCARLLHSAPQASAFPAALGAARPNVLFVSPSCHEARRQVPQLVDRFPSIEWIHVRSAGIDFLQSEDLPRVTDSRTMTNAKGQFSSSLAEYVMLACSYYAKDVPRLLKQKGAKQWNSFEMAELRGKTMGIVGYGDLGRATAKLANVFGMRVLALRRNSAKSARDPLCDAVYGTGRASLHKLMAAADYVVCSAPSTVETRGMVDAAAFAASKPGQVFINVGRGIVVDEGALLAALKDGTLRGAALDVFSTEPLPEDHELWDLDNVLISPHNMNKITLNKYMHEATEFFVNENLPRFILGDALLNPVDAALGY